MKMILNIEFGGIENKFLKNAWKDTSVSVTPVPASFIYWNLQFLSQYPSSLALGKVGSIPVWLGKVPWAQEFFTELHNLLS